MQLQTDKQAHSNTHSPKDRSLNAGGGLSTLRHTDHRPEAAMQAQLQSVAENSAPTSPLAQLRSIADHHADQQAMPVQQKKNTTGLPDNLKSGIEQLSGYSMDNVNVHYNSAKPAQLQARAYAQGTDIHVAPGQEKHLPHEAWHVVQQAQGRVQPTTQLKGMAVNDNSGLESEADVMGAKSLTAGTTHSEVPALETPSVAVSQAKLIQRYAYGKPTTRKVKVKGATDTIEFEECTKNTVTYNAGEKKRDGTLTSSPADWAGWLKNQGKDRNATQLHVVNKRWGGLGGQKDGNIVPGSPAENSHHLHEVEKEFDKCFDGSDNALKNCSYTCTAVPAYDNSNPIDVSAGDKNYNDAKISAVIDFGGAISNLPVSPGSGLTFTDGG